MGCGTNTVVQNSQPPSQVLNAYQNLVNQGQQVSQLPLQQYQGPVIAGFNPTQQTAFSETNLAQGAALPYINAGQQFLSTGTTPVMSGVQGFGALSEYQNPYTTNVTQATENLLNNQNAQQFNQANAAAASAGAFGGDREAVLQAQMAGQQQLSEAPTLANIQSQGFTGAEQELNAQQNLQLQGASATDWLNQNAAGLESGLGTTAQNSLLSGASAELQTGGLEQQLQQEELQVPESYFAQQQAYPYATTNFLAGITEGAAPGEGGTGTSTSPGPSALSQVAGLGMTGLGIYGIGSNLGWWGAAAAAARRGGRIAGFPSLARAPGGFVPEVTADDIAAIQNAIDMTSVSPVPQPESARGTSPQINAPAPSQIPQGIDMGQLMDEIGTVAKATRAQVQEERSGGRIGFPSLAMGGFPRGFASADPTGDVGDGDEEDLPPVIVAGEGPYAPPVVVANTDPGALSRPSAGANGEDDGGAGAQGISSAFPSAAGQSRASNSRSAAASPPQESGFSRAMHSPWMALLAAGAGTLSSRSPFASVALGEGLQAGLRYAQRASEPHVDSSGDTMKLVYPGGRTFATFLGSRPSYG